MSQITVSEAKLFLRIIHDDDNLLLQLLIDAAEDEIKRFCDRTELPTLPIDYPSESSSEDIPSSEDPVAPSIRYAVLLLVQVGYEGNKPEDQSRVRSAVESICYPYVNNKGV